MRAWVHRFARLSCCPTGVTPASACCLWHVITWSRTGCRISEPWRLAAASIGYVTPPGQSKIDERALHRSTLWRFVFFLGAQTAALQVGLQLWSEHDPLSTMHRFVGAVAPHKYRSEQRGEILRTARRLLHLIDRWDRTFAEPFFPRFATRPRVP